MTSMNVSLPPELANIVRGRVESGFYNDEREVVCDAIRQLEYNDELLYEIKLERLKKTLEPGYKQAMAGIYADYSLDKLKAKIRSKRKAREAMSGCGGETCKTTI